MTTTAPLAGHTVIYGGSFDPPHMGHQMGCLALLESLGADSVWLTPAFAHPFGKQLTAFEHRFAMCTLMAAPFGDRVHVSAAEKDLGGAGRTYDLVTALIAAHPKRRFALAVGADIVGEIGRWHRWPELAALVRVVVIGRSGYQAAAHTPDLPAIASRTLRTMLAAQQDVTGQMPVSVTAYIRAHGLYAKAPR